MCSLERLIYLFSSDFFLSLSRLIFIFRFIVFGTSFPVQNIIRNLSAVDFSFLIYQVPFDAETNTSYWKIIYHCGIALVRVCVRVSQSESECQWRALAMLIVITVTLLNSMLIRIGLGTMRLFELFRMRQYYYCERAVACVFSAWRQCDNLQSVGTRHTRCRDSACHRRPTGSANK